MKTIALNEFEKNCQFFLKQVENSGEPLTLLKNGIPFTRIIPCQPKRKTLFGIHQGQIQIHGDIVAPIETEWNAMK